MEALILLQATDPTNGQWMGILTAVLAITTIVLGADRKNQTDRVKDARSDIRTTKEECNANLAIERERTTRAEAREEKAIGQMTQQGTIIAEQTQAIREFATIAKDSLLESRNASAEAKNAFAESKRNGERLERLDRRTESIERITSQLAFQRGINPVAPGD